MLRKLLVVACFLPMTAIAEDRIMQPYRPKEGGAPWLIEAAPYGLLKVRVSVNGNVVGDGPIREGDYRAAYSGHAVHTICRVGVARMVGGADRDCSVYVDDELAANLTIVKR